MMEYLKRIREKVGHDRVIVAGAGVFVYKDGKVLLQRRRDDGRWSSHGGCIEVGEKAEDAAKRELFEETGLTAHSLELLGVFSGENTLYTYPNGDEVYVICIEYVCRDFSGELLTETDETLELKWFGLDDLPADITPPEVEPLTAFVGYIRGSGRQEATL